MKKYTIPDHNQVTSDNPFKLLHTYLINDKLITDEHLDTKFDENKRIDYFNAAYDLFMLKCEHMHNTNAYMTKDDEKEMQFMIDALLHARQAIYEHKQDLLV